MFSIFFTKRVFKDSSIGNSRQQRIQSKDLKQDLTNLLELTSTLQNAFVNRIGEEYKAINKNENKLYSVEHQPWTENKTIDLLSEDKCSQTQDPDAHSSCRENSEDYEPIQDFLEPKLNTQTHKNLKHIQESKYKGYSNKKNVISKEADTPRTSRGISVLSYSLSPHPKSDFTETNLPKESSPRTMISGDFEFNHRTDKRSNRNRMGLIVIGGRVQDPSKILAETVDSTMKTSAGGQTLQTDSKIHRDKGKSSSKEKVKRIVVNNAKF